MVKIIHLAIFIVLILPNLISYPGHGKEIEPSTPPKPVS